MDHLWYPLFIKLEAKFLGLKNEEKFVLYFSFVLITNKPIDDLHQLYET